jgi:hypothetical protein
MPTISPISALENLCRKKGWKANFDFTGSDEDRWKCNISVDMGDVIAEIEEGEEEETFATIYDAKIDAATFMYYKLFE